MGKRKNGPTVEEIRQELDESFRRWDDIYANGCCDPFWPDGTNLNLVRNHIIYFYRQIQEMDSAPYQLSLFAEPTPGGRPIPPEVPDQFMAKKRKCQYFYTWSDKAPVYRDELVAKK